MSQWMFSCKLGLYQGNCMKYKADKKSRGWQAGWGGCPSCVHREGDPGPTQDAEKAYASTEGE